MVVNDLATSPPSPLPTEWDAQPLSTIATIRNGGTPNTAIAEHWGGEIPWCTPTDITRQPGKYLVRTAKHLTPEGLASCSAGLLPQGALLLCSRATIGEVKIAGMEVCTNQGLKSLVATNGICNEYLYYKLLTQKSRMVERASGSTFLELGSRDLALLEVVLPPAYEQRAIAEALGDIDRLIESLETLIAKKRAIRHATMQQLLTGRTRLPGFSEEWALRRLGEHVRFLRHGTLPRSALTSKEEVAYLHYGDIHNSTAVLLGAGLARLRSLPRKAANRLDRLEDGDLVMVDASEDLDGVGKSVEIAERHGRDVVAGLHTIAARFDDAVLATGFKGYLQFVPELRRHLRRLAAGTKVYATNRSHIQSAKVRLPGLEEQRAIGAMLSDMDSELESLEQRLAKTRAIKQGAMQQLLTGRIRLPLDCHGGRSDEDIDA